jgi:WbqC-like protein family
MTVIIEYQYFPPHTFFKNLYPSTHLQFEQYENFQKRGFRHRCMIAGADGPVLLSIPLRGGRNQKNLIKDVRVDNRASWQASHWKTIVSCYNRSPWFEYYRDDLSELYKSPFEFLTDWDIACFHWIISKLEINLSVSLTEEWKEKYDPEVWDDWRNRLTPNSIPSEFLEAPRYKQVFEDRTGFIPHLSVLDLLFCEGKNAGKVLGHDRKGGR